MFSVTGAATGATVVTADELSCSGATTAATVVTVATEAVVAMVAGADELSCSAVPIFVLAKLKTGILDVSLTSETVSVAVGASDKSGSTDVVAMSVEGSAGRTVRGFVAGCGSVVEELVVDVAASPKANSAPLGESRGETAPAAGDTCGAAASFVKGDVVWDPVSERFTEPTASRSAIGRSLPTDEPTVAFTRRALPVAAAL
ncbi:hypothetical protein FHT71_003190 [Rhizobium sp. BK060]|nr:hypothetical protein [Rhizobium sp. BK060]